MKLRRWAVLVTAINSILVCSGCVRNAYFSDRLTDLTEWAHLDLNTGQFGGFIQVGPALIGWNTELGFWDQSLADKYMIGLGGPVPVRNGDVVGFIYPEKLPQWDRRGKPPKKHQWHSWGAVGAEINLFLGIGVFANPIEAADFFLGIFTFDFLQDDLSRMHDRKQQEIDALRTEIARMSFDDAFFYFRTEDYDLVYQGSDHVRFMRDQFLTDEDNRERFRERLLSVIFDRNVDVNHRRLALQLYYPKAADAQGYAKLLLQVVDQDPSDYMIYDALKMLSVNGFAFRSIYDRDQQDPFFRKMQLQIEERLEIAKSLAENSRSYVRRCLVEMIYAGGFLDRSQFDAGARTDLIKRVIEVEESLTNHDLKNNPQVIASFKEKLGKLQPNK